MLQQSILYLVLKPHTSRSSSVQRLLSKVKQKNFMYNIKVIPHSANNILQ